MAAFRRFRIRPEADRRRDPGTAADLPQPTFCRVFLFVAIRLFQAVGGQEVFNHRAPRSTAFD